MPKISIIVPIYNVSKYLRRCLDSILAQTYRDLEIICVDDGSTDDSPGIIDEYAARDARIVPVHKANAGYGAAMNTGLDMASGEYIGIVESDDCILPDMYEKLVRAADGEKLDFVKSDAYYWYETLDYKRNIHLAYMEQYYNKVLDDTYRNIFFDFYMNIWTGIYRKDFLQAHDIRFNESPGASYQDNGFWMQTLMYAERAMWLGEAFYLYRQDNPEASVKSPGKVYAMENEYTWLEEQLKNRGHGDLLPYCCYYRLFRDRGNFYRIADELKPEYREHLRQEYSRYKAYIKANSFLDTWMRRIIQDDTFCEDIISQKALVKEKIDAASSIIIYGAGYRGSIALRNLHNLGQTDKISCFAVTRDMDESVIAGKKVLIIDDAVKEYPDSLIIIATVRGSGAYQAMCNNLNKLGITNTLDVTVFEEKFYLV